MRIDPVKRALELRKTLIKDKEILVVKFDEVSQGKDTSRVIDLMPNVRTEEKVFRAKVNCKEIDPFAAEEYKKPYFDLDMHTNGEIEDFLRKLAEFDFSLWYKHDADFSMRNVLDYNSPFIFQVAGCNFNDGTPTGGCFYCYVNNKSNDGVVEAGKTYIGIEDVIESMIVAREKIKAHYKKAGINLEMKVLRASGGEPMIVPDFLLDLWRDIRKQNLNFSGQIDTNLSTGHVIDYLEQHEYIEPNTLEKLAKFPAKFLAAIKGVTDENLRDNVQADAAIEHQDYSIARLLKAGFDIFPQIYNPDPKHLREYLLGMERKYPNFCVRTHVSPLHANYSPTRERLTAYAILHGLDPEEFIKMKQKQWDEQYKESVEDIMPKVMKEVMGCGHRDRTRSDFKIGIKN